MAQIFKNARAVLGTSATDVYEVPANTVAIVVSCQVANVDLNTDRILSLWWTDASNANAVTRLGEGISVPSRSAYEPLGGKLVLEAGDKIRGTGSTATSLEATVSILELS
jgi:hypothetical protein